LDVDAIVSERGTGCLSVPTSRLFPKLKEATMGNFIVGRFSVGLLATLPLTTSAEAALVRVDWSASIPELPSPDAGPGQLSGSLGVFDVNAVGDTFVLPPDGSLTALASGFTDGFPNGPYPFTRDGGTGSPELEFLSIGTTADDFSVNLVDNNRALNSPFPNACTVDGIVGDCFVTLLDQNTSGIDVAAARFRGDPPYVTGPVSPVEYSFTIVPVPTAIWLFGSGLLGVIVLARRKAA
jgi:hypothetical protein